MLEGRGAERPQERLLERIVGRLASEQACQVAEDLVLALLVEALEGGIAATASIIVETHERAEM